MNISGISTEGYIRRIKSLEKRIMKKWHYSPDPDYIQYLLDQSVTSYFNVTDQLNYNYDLQKTIIDYLLSEDCRADHGIGVIKKRKDF